MDTLIVESPFVGACEAILTKNFLAKVFFLQGKSSCDDKDVEGKRTPGCDAAGMTSGL